MATTAAVTSGSDFDTFGDPSIPLGAMPVDVDSAVALALAWGDSQGVLVARLRLAAALYPPPTPQPKGKRGPKPTKGTRQRRLKVGAARSDPPWQEGAVDW